MFQCPLCFRVFLVFQSVPCVPVYLVFQSVPCDPGCTLCSRVYLVFQSPLCSRLFLVFQCTLQGVKCPIFSYFFLFFTKIPIFSYFSAIFFDFHIIFSQKLKEASEIRRISCLGKSHSCEIASLWSFPPKSSHDQPASVVLPQSRVLIHSFMTVRVFGYVFCVYFRIYEMKLLLMFTSQIFHLACTLMKQQQHR